jgi:hypothetical protein
MLILGHYGSVLRAFAVLANAAPSNTDYGIHLNYIKDFKYEGYIAALNDIFAGYSDADLANMLLKSTGLDTIDLEGDGNNDNSGVAQAFLAANSANRVGAIIDLVAAFQKITVGPAAAPAAAFNANFNSAYAYATNAENTTWRSFDGSVEHVLTTGMDKLVGGAMNDYFKAYLVNGQNTFQDGDVLDGGAGNDTLFADVNASQQGFVITGQTKGIENVLFRVQNGQWDSGDNNIAGVGIIDAERMKDVLNWENNNSRADLVIEDVRINDNQITRDITITMRETDPGQVDYGVYFDQNSLRNSVENASQMNLRVLDTYAVAQGKNALLDSPYGAFTFYVSIGGGAATTVKLESDAMQNAQTLDEMVVAMQAAADDTFGAGAVAVTLGSVYNVKDSVTGNDVAGNEIIIAAKGTSQITFDTTGAGSGWLATDTVPAISGLYTSFTTGATVTTDLVTSTIVLDYVGRGSTGGDLVVGGLSVGDTSKSKGVQKFDITVEDDSRLQTMNSTNNTLMEVVIKNGAQTRINDAYNKVDELGGLLHVNGISAGGDLPLPGSAAQHNAYGFSDVRLIDGSAMTGKLSFTAEITAASKAKYLNLTDSQSNPAGDNVEFVYSGGSNDDTMVVAIDSGVAASINSLTAREDFKFILNGGAGNDKLSVGITDVGGTWYANQSQLNNVEINGGEGNDTINTTTTGDFVVKAGSGNDTVYSANTGNKSVWTVGNSSADFTNLIGIDYTQGNSPNYPHDNGGVNPVGDPLFLANGKLTVVYSGPGIAAPASGGVMGASATGGVAYNAATGIGVNARHNDALNGTAYSNGLEVTVDVPYGANYAVTQYHINQAIKNAINNDPVLNKLLKAEDGTGSSLVITSLVDGAHVGSDLTVTVYRDAAYAASNNDVVNAYKAFTTNSQANLADAEAAAINTTTVINLREGMVNDATPGAANNFAAGSDSLDVSASVFDLGAGVDMLVLNTNSGSVETVKFTVASGVDATVVNFTDTGAGADLLDFTQYLTSKITATGSASQSSQDFIDIQLNTNATVDANTLTILSGINFTKAKTFDGLTADLFKAAINSGSLGTTDYAGIHDGTLEARADYNTAGGNVLVGNLGKAIVMVEHDDNLGEYKVFELSFKGQTGTNVPQDFDTVTLIGVVDFGASLTGVTSANLVDQVTFHNYALA